MNERYRIRGSLAAWVLLALVAFCAAFGGEQTDPIQPKPAYLVETTDAVTGRTLMRIANDEGASTGVFSRPDTSNGPGRWGAGARHHYSTDQPWSSNQSYYFMENNGEWGNLILDGRTFAPLMHVCQTILMDDGSPAGVTVKDSWWYLPHKATDEEYRVAIDTSPGVHKLFVYSVLTCKIKQESGFDFVWVSSLPGGLADGVSEAQSWGSHGAVVVLVDTLRKRLQVIDMTRNIKGPIYNAYAGGSCGAPHVCTGPAKNFCATDADCAAPATCGACIIDWAAVSPSGAYLVLSYDGLDFVRVLRIDPNTLALTPVDYTATGQVFATVNPSSDADYCVDAKDKGFIFNLGHASLGIDPSDGNADVIVGERHCSNKGTTQFGVTAMGDVAMVKLETGVVKALTHHTDAAPEANARHVSLLSYDNPGWAIVTYDDSGPATAVPCKKYWDEIVRVSMLGETVALQRLVRTHTLTSSDTSLDAYRCEGHAVPSPDGKRIAFASCWAKFCGGSCGDVSHPQDYVIDRTKAPSWTTPPQEVSPDGLWVPLTIGKSGTDLVVAFAESAGASTYNIYRGSLASLRLGIYDHASAPSRCGLNDAAPGDGGVTVTLAGASIPDGSYLLAVARNAVGESIYGTKSDGSPIPAATTTCP